MQNLPTSFTIEQLSGCASLLFTDTSQYGNGGGSGENPSLAEVTGTTIEFDLSNGETVTITNFLPTQGDTSIQIFSGDLGYGTATIPDQICTVTYTVLGGSGEVLGTATTPILFSCNFQTCYAAKVLSAVGDKCCGKDELLELAMMNIRFTGIQATVERNAGCASGAIEDLTFECLKNCNNGCQ